MRQNASSDGVIRVAACDASDPTALDAALTSRALWKDLCETVGDLIFETDRAGRFAFLAPSEALGYQTHTLIGHFASDILCGWDRPETAVANPFTSPRAIRMQHVWLRKQDGSAALFAVSARRTDLGGTLGVGIDVTSEDDMVRASVRAVLLQSTVDRIQTRMREEVLTPRIIRAGLDELVECLGAEGASVMVTTQAGRPDTDENPLDPATLPLYVTGNGWDEVGPELAKADDAGADLHNVAQSVAAAGRHPLLCSMRTRFGPAAALAIWRRLGRPGWREDERLLAAAVAAALRGVIEQDSIQREITDHSRTDVLTGLLSRRCFFEEARRRFDRLDRNGQPATLIILDLDDFRLLNERVGQDRGDEALCRAAAFLRDTFRHTHLVCRTAGDEFAVWLDGADVFAAAERAEWLCRSGITVRFDHVTWRRGISIGLASRPARSLEDLESLCRRAGSAMHFAKQSGKGVWRASQQEIET